MANANKAPLFKEPQPVQSVEDAFLAQEFDPSKKYMFELASKNLERELPVFDMVTKRPVPHQEFKPSQNIVLTSQIVWKGSRANIRYYDGCDSIFVSEQPKEKETIEQLMKQTKKRFFEKGKFGCYGDERMLLLYLNACSWNAESPFKTRTSDTIFTSVNADKKASQESARLDMIEKAILLAKEASKNKMYIHANFLGIPTTDWDSGNELTEAEVRSAYRKEALQNPSNFVETFGNKSIEVKYYIDKAIESGLINNKFNSNKATWSNSNSEICDISGLRSPEAIAAKLFEFSQLEDGQEFVIQLKSIYNS